MIEDLIKNFIIFLEGFFSISALSIKKNKDFMYSYYSFNDCRKEKTKEEKSSCKRSSLRTTKTYWLKDLTYGPNKKASFLANIWLSIFAVNARSFLNPHWILDQINSVKNCFN